MTARETFRDRARKHWLHEQWGEPRDADQERLWVQFFMGDVNPSAAWRPNAWTRPGRWIEELVRK